MRYKIKDIPDEGLVVDQALPDALLREALDGMDADVERSAAAAHLQISRTDEDVFVRGRLTATLSLPCAACLQPTRVDVAVPLNVIYRPEEEEELVENAEADPFEDLELGFHDRKELDLTPLLREQLILSVPMAAHCKENCKGLCSVCGQNRNEGDCGHQPQPGESPFAARLKNIKLE